VRSIDDDDVIPTRPATPLVACGLALAIAGCTSQTARAPVETPSPVTPAEVAPQAPRNVTLPTPENVRSWDQYRAQAARRMVAATPDGSYTSVAPEVLLAIPVLEVELNADGGVRRITVLRYPRQAADTTQLAIDAVRRAAPYGDVSRLSKPWKFTETFLFDDNRRFKPRTLD
jgi:hypothetical protein